MRAIKPKVCYYSKRLRTSDNFNFYIVNLLNSRSKMNISFVIWIIIHITYVYYISL